MNERSDIAVGTRVRLKPNRRADIFDLALHNRRATVVAVEHDRENRVYLAVALDDDPGGDLAASGRPGHRFYFAPEEVEPLADNAAEQA
jgi:hypothetical protein